MSYAPFVTGTLLSAKQKIVGHHFLLKQFCELGPWFKSNMPLVLDDLGVDMGLKMLGIKHYINTNLAMSFSF